MKKLLSVLSLTVLLLADSFAWGPTPTAIILGWTDTNAETEQVVGFKIYSGTVSGQYTAVTDAHLNYTVSLTGFQRGVQYFFAVTAVNAAGLESDYSAELVYRFDNLPSTPTQFRIIQATKDR